jgi:hypothetical protein
MFSEQIFILILFKDAVSSAALCSAKLNGKMIMNGEYIHKGFEI